MLHFLDPAFIDVETHNREFVAERKSNRQSNVAQTGYGQDGVLKSQRSFHGFVSAAVGQRGYKKKELQGNGHPFLKMPQGFTFRIKTSLLTFAKIELVSEFFG